MTSIKEELFYKRFFSLSFLDTILPLPQEAKRIWLPAKDSERVWYNTEVLLCISKSCDPFFFCYSSLLFFFFFQKCTSKTNVLYRLTGQVYFLCLGIYHSCVEEVVPGTKYVKRRARVGDADMRGSQLQGLSSRTSSPAWAYEDREDLENRENVRWVCVEWQT